MYAQFAQGKVLTGLQNKVCACTIMVVLMCGVSCLTFVPKCTYVHTHM